MSNVPEYQQRYEKENTVCVNIRFSRYQDPELFDLLIDCQGSRGTLARQLMREALTARKIAESQKKA